MENFRNRVRSRLAHLAGRYRGYLAGLFALVLLVVARRTFLDEFFDNTLPLRLFILPVMAAAWSGGITPGVFTTFFGAVVASYAFDLPVDWQNTLVFVIVGCVVSAFMESLHATRRRLEDRQSQLEREVLVRQRAQDAEREQRNRLAEEIDRRATIEWALREREERIRMAVESANIGTWDLNVLTGERQWSDRTRVMFGIGPEESISSISFTDLLHPEDRQQVGEAVRQALDPAGNGRYEVEYRAVLRDGQTRWIAARGQAFFRGEGVFRQAARFIGTVFDSTKRKELEHALQDADRRKDEFLATLAHELRNPLTPISYAVQLWPMVEGDAEKVTQLRSMISQQIEHITRLIDDLMDVSRITRGKIELQRQPVDIATVVTSSIESVKPVIESCGHRLVVATPNEPELVDGDVARLTQVFGNILSNAAKYTSHGGVIWVTVASSDGKVVVSIRDNGPGIPRHMLKDIFEMFHQLDNTVSRSHGGLGIGLTLVKQLVELHGGTVEALSEGPGQGSEFVVTLPAKNASTAKKSDGYRYQLQHLNVLPSRRILVVDDIEASAKALAMMLRAMGQNVVALHDGQSAIDWVVEHRPDAVFLDIAMPTMSGYEVARRLRENKELQSTVLVALTGYGQEEDRRHAFEAGFNHHMVKPPNIDALEQVLRGVPGPAVAGSSLTEDTGAGSRPEAEPATAQAARE